MQIPDVGCCHNLKRKIKYMKLVENINTLEIGKTTELECWDSILLTCPKGCKDITVYLTEINESYE